MLSCTGSRLRARRQNTAAWTGTLALSHTNLPDSEQVP